MENCKNYLNMCISEISLRELWMKPSTMKKKIYDKWYDCMKYNLVRAVKPKPSEGCHKTKKTYLNHEFIYEME